MGEKPCRRGDGDTLVGDGTFCRSDRGDHGRGDVDRNHIGETWCASTALGRTVGSLPRGSE